MRRRFTFRLALALGAVIALSAGLIQQGSAQGSDGSGEFIIRCFYNGNVATYDPIEEPGSFNTDHLHAFFGNMASGGFALNGTTQIPFPTMMAGEKGHPGSMENNGLSPTTNCQDDKDTAGYWVPEPFMTGPSSGATAPWLPGGGCSANCSTSTNLYMRDYYIPHKDKSANQEIPDGTIMIAGFPAGCANIDGTEPDGCTVGGPSYPNDLKIAEYSCGANNAAGEATPTSAWPYDCTNYTDSDDLAANGGFSDGEVTHVLFPDCWNGNSDFPAPNSPVNAKGLPTDMVPGYVAPWIPYTAWQNYPGLTQRPSNDFSYSDGGACPQGDTPVVGVQERVHLLTYGQGWGEPSTCTSETGNGWNTASNAESSPSGGSTPSDTAETLNGKTNDDNDASVQVGSSGGTAIWGFHKCVAASAPSPASGVRTLSFACTNGADPNCTDNIGIPSVTTGCGTAGGDCYVGAYPYGWETLHADYWQTWQENQNALDSSPTSDDIGNDDGTFGDIVEDCVQGSGTACHPEFITNTAPAQVYGPGGNNNP